MDQNPPTDHQGPSQPRPARRGGRSGSPNRDSSNQSAESGKKRKSPASARKTSGFGDTIERAFCQRYLRTPPVDFPVVHRRGIATLKAVVVDRRQGAVLFCDSAHPGDHIWPDPVLDLPDPPPDAEQSDTL